jgi:predicted transcriptional regulator
MRSSKWRVSKLPKSVTCKLRRGRCEIVKSILEAARGGAIKTRIMKKARVNNAQANRYFGILEKHDLLSRVGLSTGKSIVWKTTDAGLKAVEACEKCHSLFSDFF